MYLLNIPSSLKILFLKCYSYSNHLDDLPSSLESLIILCDYLCPIKNLPIGLKNFAFADRSNSKLNLPTNIKNVWFDESNNKLRRLMLKINPKVCYNDINSYQIDIETFEDIIVSTEQKLESKCENSDGSDDNDSSNDSDKSSSDSESDKYNHQDDWNHNVLIKNKLY
jgi:hypothetical protein